MLCFFMFFLMTVSSAPLGLVHGKQASKHVAEIMSHPRLSQALFQNKTFLSELVEADPETLNTILGHLNDLLAVSQAASLAFTTDVSAALSAKVVAQGALTEATSEFDVAQGALTEATSEFDVAQGALTEATSEFDVASSYHTAMVDELNDKQPGVDAETETLRRSKVLIETLIPAGEWLLIIRSHLGSVIGGRAFKAFNAFNGDLAVHMDHGVDHTDDQGNFKIGETGAQLYSEGYDQVRVTINGQREVIFNGTIDARGFDNTCTVCNCLGNDIGAGLFWHGGRGGCHRSSHYGIATTSDPHATCNGGSDAHYGHFHRHSVNTGVYVYGKDQDNCISENEWDTTMEYWLRRSTGDIIS